MPCYDSRDSYDRVEYRDNPKVSAMLCALLSVLEAKGTLEATLRAANWKESGVSTGATIAWWNAHKRVDEWRKEREIESAKLDRKRDEETFARLKKRLGK